MVNADGLIYKCWNEMGIQSCSVGSLKDGVKECSRLHSYMLYDATEDPECRACSFLPVCMGGCPNARLQNPTNRCTAMKHGLDFFMSVIPSILESQIDVGEREDPRTKNAKG